MTLRQTLLGPLLRGADMLYLAFQSALKTYGLVSPGQASFPPEQTDAEGRRYALIPRRQDRWPELRVPLPDTAIHWYSVESLFRRAELWRGVDSVADIRTFLRQHLPGTWHMSVLDRGTDVTRFELSGGGVTNQVQVTALPDGGFALSAGQKVRRLRFDEAERALAARG